MMRAISRAGDRRHLVERMRLRYGGRLVRYFYRRVPNRDQAREMAQETYEHFLAYVDPETVQVPRAMLFLIARHRLIRRAKVQSREIVEFDSNLSAEAAAMLADPMALDPAERVELQDEIVTALSNLPPHRASVLIRRALGDSWEEIATDLRLKVTTVERYLKLARNQSRAFLRE